MFYQFMYLLDSFLRIGPEIKQPTPALKDVVPLSKPCAKDSLNDNL